jgi:GNAT superfamily N-acetyltransferase
VKIEKITDTKIVESLFQGWEETMIWSCLQGVMGEIYADNLQNPRSAMAILGDFVFFAGEPCMDLILYKPDWCTKDFMILVPQNASWAELIETCYGDRAKKTSRYAIRKEPDVFDRGKLRRAVASLPEEYSIRLIDEELYHRCRTLAWCKDWVAQYKDYDTFRRLGVGVVILKDGELVSGASSYASYQGGIEIEIDTHEQYRRRGLAYICGAGLILECLERNLYPSWDAQNLWSVALAEKLGYHYSHTYTVYEIWGN